MTSSSFHSSSVIKCFSCITSSWCFPTIFISIVFQNYFWLSHLSVSMVPLTISIIHYSPSLLLYTAQHWLEMRFPLLSHLSLSTFSLALLSARGLETLTELHSHFPSQHCYESWPTKCWLSHVPSCLVIFYLKQCGSPSYLVVISCLPEGGLSLVVRKQSNVLRVRWWEGLFLFSESWSTLPWYK